MSDDLRSLNGVSPTLGASGDLRPAGRTDMDPDEGDGSPGYQRHRQPGGDHPREEPRQSRPPPPAPSARETADVAVSLLASLDRLRVMAPLQADETFAYRGLAHYRELAKRGLLTADLPQEPPPSPVGSLRPVES